MRKIIIILLTLALPTFGYTTCNNYPNAKACPSSGSILLDDTYPAAAYVISIKPVNITKASEQVPSDFILKVLESYNYSDDAPPIIVPSDSASYERLIARITEKINDSKGKIPNNVLDKIKHANAQRGYTWQQDHMESFVDLETGNPQLRQIESYRDKTTEANEIAMSGESCRIKNGPVLKHSLKSKGNGEMGGNIEGLPGGLCLVGDNQGTDFTEQFCGDKSNIVQVDVSWLTVGHVDELFKVVPTYRPGVPAECNFSLLVASPKKAIELLQTPATANHSFFSNDSLNASASKESLLEFRKSRTQRKPGTQLCKLYENSILPKRNKMKPDSKTKPEAKQALKFIENFILGVAHAGILPVSNPECMVETITNFEFLNSLNESNLKSYNDLVQKSLDESKAKIIAKILERLPQCRPHFSAIDVPDLFYGTPKVNEDGSKDLAKPGNSGSFMPNPTNSVMSNNTLIISDPQNDLFKKYLDNEMKKSGLKTTFIDTWDYAHLGDGNLHCSSHTIPYCKPGKK